METKTSVILSEAKNLKMSESGFTGLLNFQEKITMALFININKELEAELRLHLQHKGVELSEFVQDAVREKLAKIPQANSPYELGMDLFGRYASGDTQRSVCRKTILREKIHAKHRH